MKTLLLTILSLHSISALADFSCNAIYKYKEEGQFKSKTVQLPVTYDAHGFTKLQADEKEAFYSVNKDEDNNLTLSIAFPPDYTLGTISSSKLVDGKKSTISMVNGVTLYKLVCQK